VERRRRVSIKGERGEDTEEEGGGWETENRRRRRNGKGEGHHQQSRSRHLQREKERYHKVNEASIKRGEGEEEAEEEKEVKAEVKGSAEKRGITNIQTFATQKTSLDFDKGEEEVERGVV